MVNISSKNITKSILFGCWEPNNEMDFLSIFINLMILLLILMTLKVIRSGLWMELFKFLETLGITILLGQQQQNSEILVFYMGKQSKYDY